MAGMSRALRYLKITLDGDVSEGLSSPYWFSRQRLRFWDLVELLQRAKTRSNLSCLWMVVKNNGLGWSQIEELHLHLDELAQLGKRTLIFLEEADNKDYYLACGFEEIRLAPATSLGLIGLRSELIFLGDLLKWAGVNPQIIQVGDYKSAAEIFTRHNMSEASREMLDSILEDFQGRLVERIARRRSVEGAQAQNWIDQGPYTSKRALELGLVDGICYEDEIEEELERGETPLKRLPSRKVLRREGWLRRRATWRRPQIALVVVEGLIQRGRSGRGLGRLTAGSDSVRKALRRAREAKRVKAVVLRVNSPGGSALASDLIWREVALTDGQKPVIVTFGGEAASGGYYLAVGARHIYAMPGTLTGSIGVVGGKFNIMGLLRALRVERDFVEKGAHSGLNSPMQDFDQEEQALVRELSESAYRDFLERVAQGRDLNLETVERLARGRIWTGKQARERGLVDALGGLTDAIQKAREAAEISTRRFRLVQYVERRGLWDLLPLPRFQAPDAELWTTLRWRIR